MAVFQLWMIGDHRDLGFFSMLHNALGMRGVASHFLQYSPIGGPEFGRDGLVFVLSRNWRQTSMLSLTDQPELLPFVVVRTDDTLVPLSLRDATTFDSRVLTMHVLASAIEKEFARILPASPEELTIPVSPDVRALRNGAVVFICYAREDEDHAAWLQFRLESDGFITWRDVPELLPGRDWDHEIGTTMRRATVALICLSRSSIEKDGYVQREIDIALDIASELPDGRDFIIPVRLDDCAVPERLRRWQLADGVLDESYQRIVAAIDGIIVGQ